MLEEKNRTKTFKPTTIMTLSERIRRSNIPHKITHPALEGFGNLGHGFQGGFLLRPFDVADIISRQPRFFRQLLLAVAGLLSRVANGFSQNLINSARGQMHSFESNQNQRMLLPTGGWYFYACAAGRRFIEVVRLEGKAIKLMSGLKTFGGNSCPVTVHVPSRVFALKRVPFLLF